MSQCRFCKDDDQNQLVKYEVRHYAHASCLMKAKGAKAFDYFGAWQLETQWPYLPVIRAGLQKEFDAALAEAKEREEYQKGLIAQSRAEA